MIERRLPATAHADFRRLLGGSACSSIALWTMLLGNAWVVYKMSGSSFWVGIATFASMFPFLLAPFGGVIADRVERRFLVQVTRAGLLVTCAFLFVLALTGVLTVWMVVFVAFVQGTIRAVQQPADQALLANLVPPGDIANAVTLTTMTQQGSRAAGPLLSGPLLAVMGVEGAYGIATVFALLGLLSVRRISVTSRGGAGQLREVVESLRHGLSYVGNTRPVLLLFLLVTAHCSLTMSFDAMLPGFAETELHSPSSGFTLMTFGVGAGALIGTFWLSWWPFRQRGTLLLWTGVASGLSPVLMAGSMAVPAAVGSSILMGSSQAMFMALISVLLQEVVPDAVRGRVMSLYLMSAGGIMAFANLGFGSLADAVGAPVLFLIPGAAFAVVMLASRLYGRHLRAVYRTGTVPVASA